ncbi:MAG: hypothetical protein IJ681_06730 [Bacteroidales bacterium]|nr:hypothetical protein [Bacteroidales bacterium]
MMYWKKGFIGIIVAMICIVMSVSCDNNSGNGDKGKDVLKDGKVTLMKNMTLVRMGLNDTVNNIHGALFFVRHIKKDNDNINLKPATEFMTADLRKFAKTVKSIENPNRVDTNFYELSVRSIYEQDDMISVLYERKSHLTGTKDTINELLSYNYDKETEEEYSFFQVFNVTSSSLREFNELFQTSFTLEELNAITFNFEKDMVWLNTSTNNVYSRYGQPKRKVKKFLIDD